MAKFYVFSFLDHQSINQSSVDVDFRSKNNTIFLKVQNIIDREMRYINKETSPKTAIPIYHII